jgi:hypothetical protein
MGARSTTLEFDVARNEWARFLDEFSSDHRSWLTTIERCDRSGGTEVLARDVPLASVAVDRSSGTAQRIRIAFTGSDQAEPGILEIPDPVALRLVEPPGRVPSLEIHHGSGDCTRVRFRNVPLPELLDGIAPGEVDPHVS